MAGLVRYFIRKLGANFVDFSLDYPGYTLNGTDVVFLGNTGVDRVYLQKGVKFNFSNSGAGTDEIYLDGSFVEFTLSARGTSTLVLTSAARANTEITLAQEDKVFFNNGSVAVADLLTYAIARSANLADPTDPANPAPALPVFNAAENSLNLPSTSNADGTSNLNSILRAYTKDLSGAVFAQPSAGVKFIVTGHNGVDQVYVAKGGEVNASNLGSGIDLIYLTGRKSEYTASASGTSVLILTKGTEKVTLASEDKVVFADGSTLVSKAITAANSANSATAWAALSLDSGTFSPSPAPLLSIKSGQDAYLMLAETSIDLDIGFDKLATGDTVQLKLGGSALGSLRTVTAAEAAYNKISFNVPNNASLGANGSKTITAVVTHSGTALESLPLSLTLDNRPISQPTITLGAGVSGGASKAEALAASGVVNVKADAGSLVRLTFTDSAASPRSLIKTVTATGAAQAVTLLAADLGNGAGQLQDGAIKVRASEQYAALPSNVSGVVLPVSSIGTGSFTLDTSAPALVASPSAHVSGSNLTINYNSPLDPANKAAPGHFQVLSTPSGAGATTAAVPVTAVSVTGNSLKLTLGSAIASGATVTVSFVDPSDSDDANTVQDLAGNDAPSFASLAVSNDSAAPTAPTIALGAGVSNGATLAEATANGGVVMVTAEAGSKVLVTFTDSADATRTLVKTVLGNGTTPVPVVIAETDLVRFHKISWSADLTQSGSTNHLSLYAIKSTTLTDTPTWDIKRSDGLNGGFLGTLVTGGDDLPTVKTALINNVLPYPYAYANTVFTFNPVSFNVTATATDPAGNIGAATAPTTFTYLYSSIPGFTLGTGVSDIASATEATANTGVIAVTAESGSTVRLTFSDSASPAHRLIRTLTGTSAAQAVTLAGSELGNGSAQLQDGTISVTATATNAANIVSGVGSASFVLDATDPSLSSASVVRTKLTLHFNEPLDSTQLPAVGQFAVKQTVSGTETTVNVSSVAVSGSQVVLTLASEIPNGATATVAYTDSTTGDDSTLIIQDKAGNDLASFTASSVTVNTSANPAPTLALGSGVTGAASLAEAMASSGVVTVTADAGAKVLVTFADSDDSTHTFVKTVVGNGATPVPVVLTLYSTITKVAWSDSPNQREVIKDPFDGLWRQYWESVGLRVFIKSYPSSVLTWEDLIPLLDAEGLLITSKIINNLPFTKTITNAPNNPRLITVTATATDASNTVSTPVTTSFTLDAYASTPTLTLGAGVSGGATLAEATASTGVLSLTAESGSTVLLTFSDSATPSAHRLVKTLTASGAAQGITLAGSELGNGANQLQDGSISVSAIATDVAGNVSSVGSSSFQIDSIAPVLAAPTASIPVISVVNNKLTLNFDDTLTSSNLPGVGSFAVKYTHNGSETTLNVSSVAVSGSQVVLTLASDVPYGATATVAYTDPSSADDANAIQDAVGNDLASFSARAASNLKPAAPAITLGSGVSGVANFAETTASSGVVLVTGEAGAKVLVTFTDSSYSSHSFVKTVTGNGATQVPVVLTGEDLAIFGNVTVKWDYAYPSGGDWHYSFSLNPGDGFWTQTSQQFERLTGAPIGSLLTVTTSNPAGSIAALKASQIQERIATATTIWTVTYNFTRNAPVPITVTATAADTTGNYTSTPGTASFDFDATAPIPTITLGAGVTGGATLAEATDSSGVVSVSAEAGTRVLLILTDSASPTAHSLVRTLSANGAAQPLTLASSEIGTGPGQLQEGSISVTAITTDAAGNSSVVSSSFTLDSTAPVITAPTDPDAPNAGAPAISVVDNLLTLNFDGPMGSSNLPPGSAFVVKSTPSGGSEAVVAVNSIAVSGSQVVLTLASAIAKTASTTVAYTDPTSADDSNAIQDAAGNDLPSFAARAVSNIKPAAPTLALGLAVLDIASLPEATDSSGVLTVTGELGKPVALTLSDTGYSQHTITKTVTSNGATQVPVVLTAEDLAVFGTATLKWDYQASATALTGYHYTGTLAPGSTVWRYTRQKYTLATGKDVGTLETLSATTAASSVALAKAAAIKNGQATDSTDFTLSSSFSHSTLPIRVTALAADAEGNYSSPTGSFSFSLDTAAATPSFTLGAGISGGATAAEATASSGVVTVSTEAGSIVRLTFTDSSSPAHSLVKTISNSLNLQPITLASSELGSGASQLADGSIRITASATDVAGNVSSEGSSSFTLDSVAPAITAPATPAGAPAVSVAGNKLTINFDDSMSSSLPAASAFVVKSTPSGGTATEVAVSSMAVSGSQVVLTLASAIPKTASVSVAYTDPTTSDDSNAIQDAAGNDLPTFAARAVSNILPTTPSIVLASGVTGVVSLSEATRSGGLVTVSADSGKLVALTFTDSGYSQHSIVKTITAGAAAVPVVLSAEDVAVFGSATLQWDYVESATDLTGYHYSGSLAPGATVWSITRQPYTLATGKDLGALESGFISVPAGSIAQAKAAVIKDERATDSTLFSLSTRFSNPASVAITATALAADAIGNFSSAPGSISFSLDSFTPAPVITLGAGVSGGATAAEASASSGVVSVLAEPGSIVRVTFADSGSPVRSLVKTITATSTEQPVTLAPSDVTGASQLRDGNISISASATDAAGNLSSAASSSFKLDKTAPTAPSASSASVVDDKLTINLNETLDSNNLPASSTFLVKYTPSGGSETTAAVDSVAISGSQVVLTLGTAIPKTATAVKLSYTDPTTSDDSHAIQDTAGNDLATFATLSVSPIKPPTPSIVLASGVTGDVSRSEATLSSGVLTVTGEANRQVLLTLTDSSYSGHSIIKTATATSAAKPVVLTAEDLVVFAAAVTVSWDYVESNTAETGYHYSRFLAPGLSYWRYSQQQFTVATGLNLGALETGATTIPAGNVAQLWAAETLLNPDTVPATKPTPVVVFNNSDAVPITVTASAADAIGNFSSAPGSFSFSLDTFAAPPSISLGLGISDGATAAEASASTGVISVSAESGGSVLVTFTDSSATPRRIIKTIATATGAAQTITLAASELGVGASKLADGNISISASTTDAAGNTSSAASSSFKLDSTAPLISTGTNAPSVLDDKLTINLNETLDSTYPPPNSAFTVTYTPSGGSATAVAVSGSAISGSQVVLTLFAPIPKGATVKLSYTDPSTSDDNLALQDAVGNDLASITAANALSVSNLKLTTPTLALGTGLTGTISRAEATLGSGLLSVTGDTGKPVLVTFTDSDYSGRSILKTVTGAGATRVPVALTADDIALFAAQVTLSWDYAASAALTGYHYTRFLTLGDSVWSYTEQQYNLANGQNIGSLVIGATNTPAGSLAQLKAAEISAGKATASTAFTTTPRFTNSNAVSINVSASATDSAGKPLSDTASYSFNLDLATATPVLNLLAGFSDGATAAEATASSGVVNVTAESGGSVLVTFTDSASPTRHSVIKTIATASGAAQAVTLAGSDIGLGASKLLDGNISISATAKDAEGNTSTAASSSFKLDTTAPSVSTSASPAITVLDNKLTLNFNETLDNNPPSNTVFTVLSTPSGGTATAVGISSLFITGSQVVLTLNSAIPYGSTVTVAYADPSTSDDTLAIQDPVGNDLATFAARSASNLKLATPVLALGNGVSGGATEAEATASTGVLTVTGALGAKVLVTLADSADNTHTLVKTVTGNGATPVPVVLTAADVFVLGSVNVKWDFTTPGGVASHQSLTFNPSEGAWYYDNQTYDSVTGLNIGAPAKGKSIAYSGDAENVKKQAVTGLVANANTVFTVTSAYAITATATATDGTGNTSALATSNFTLDTYIEPLSLSLPSGVSAGASLAEATGAAGYTGITHVYTPLNLLDMTAEFGSKVLITFTDSATPTAHRLIKTIIGTGLAQAIKLAASDLGNGASQLQDGSITATATATDPAGNVSSQASSSFVLDTTAPTLTTLTVVGNQLTLNFNEELDATNAVFAPPSGLWTVNYTPLGGSPSSRYIGPVVVTSGKQMLLTLDVPVPYGAAVTLTYNPGSIDQFTNVIQDKVGNDVPGFTQTVTNLTPSVPTITSVSFSDTVGDSRYGKPGAEVTATLKFSEAISFTNPVGFAFQVGSTGPVFTRSYPSASNVSSINFQLSLPDASVGASNANIRFIGISPQASDIVGASTGKNLRTSDFSPLSDPSYWVDSTAPALPSITLGTGIADGATRAEATASSGVISVSAESGSSLVVTLTDSLNHGFSKTLTATGTAQALTLAATDIGLGTAQLFEGSIRVSATATDLAGNSSTSTSSFSLNDTVAPDAPGLTLGTGISDGASRAEATASSGVIKVQAESGSTVRLTFTDSSTPTAHSIIKTLTGGGLPMASAVAVSLSAADLGAGSAQLADGTIRVTATATDKAGNLSGTSASSFSLDTVAPLFQSAVVVGNQLTLRYDSALDSETAQLPLGTAFSVMVTNPGAVTGSADTVTATSVSGNNLLLTLTDPVAPNATVTLTYTVPPTVAAVAAVPAAGATPAVPAVAASGPVQDLAGNSATALSSRTVTNSTPLRPVITNVVLTDGDSGDASKFGKQGAGGLTATVTFSEEVNVAGGAVTLTFGNPNGADSFTGTIAADANASTFSKTKTVSFTGSTLPAGDFAVSLKSVTLASGASVSAKTPANGGTGGVLDASNFSVGGALGTGYTVDNTPPFGISRGGRLFAVDSSNAAIDPAVRDTLKVGDKVVIEIPFDQATTLTNSPAIEIRVGSTDSYATCDASFPGTTASRLYATYTIAAGDADADGIRQYGGAFVGFTGGISNMSDLAGNSDTTVVYPLADTGNIPWLKVDGTAPTIRSLGLGTPSNNRTAFAANDKVLVAVVFSEKVLITGSPQIPLTIGSTARNAVYDSSNPLNTDTLKYFSYTIAAGETDTDGIEIAASALDLNSGTITDVAGNPATLTSAAVAALTSHRVDTTAPSTAPTLALGSGVSGGANRSEALQSSGVITVSGESGSNVVLTFTDSASPSHRLTKTLVGTGAAQAVTLSSFDLGSASNQLQDGTINISAKVQDDAGNVSPTDSISFTLAATPPALTLSLGSTGITEGATAAEATASSGVVKVNGAAGSTITLTFSDSTSPAHTLIRTLTGTGADQPVTLVASELGNGSAQLADGLITVTASNSNASDNSNSKATQFVLDTVVPTGVPTGGARTGLDLTTSAGYAIPSAAANVSNNLTLESWLYVEAFYNGVDTQIVHLRSNSSSDDAIYLALKNEQLYFEARAGSTILGTVNASSAFPTQVWVHVAVTVGSVVAPATTAPVTLYIDGVQVATGTLSAAIPTATRGSSVLGTAAAITFALADVRIYDNDRTAADIRNDMAGTVDISDSNLKGYYPFSTSASASGLTGGDPITQAPGGSATMALISTLKPLLHFSADTGTAGDYITSTHNQTITFKLTNNLAANDVLWGSLDNGTTWTTLNHYVSGRTLTWTNANLLVGTNTLKFKLTDKAGNQGATEFSQIYQTGALTGPTLSLPATVADGASRAEATASSGVVSVRAASGSSVVVSFTDALNHSLSKTLTATSSAQQVTLASSDIGTGANQLYNGPITVKAQATPTGGVASEASTSSFTLYADMLNLGSGVASGASKPEALQASGVLKLLSPEGSRVQVTFTDSASPAHSVVKVLIGSGATQAITLAANDLGAGAGKLQDGTISVTAEALDAVTNTTLYTGTTSFVLDTFTGPSFTANAVTNPTVAANRPIIYADSGSTVRITFTDTSTPAHSLIKTVLGQGAGIAVPVTLDSTDLGSGTSQLREGNIQVSLLSTSTDGNLSNQTTSSFILDTVAPTAVVSSQKGLILNSNKVQYVQLPAAAAAVSAIMTLEAWVYVPAGQSNTTFLELSSTDYTANNYMHLGINASGQLHYQAKYTNYPLNLTSSSAFPLNSWHHVAVSIGQLGISYYGILYIDGVSVSNATVTPSYLSSLTKNSSFVGHSNFVSYQDFSGAIRDVRIYNLGRSNVAIEADMGGFVDVSDASLIGYYPFSTSVTASGITGGSAAVPKYTSLAAFPFPTIGNPSLRFSADTGIPNDFITSTQTQTITATLTEPLGAGETLWGRLDSGSTWTNLSASVSGNTLTWNLATLLSGSGRQLQLKVQDAAGNEGPVLTQAYSYVNDTVAPTATIDTQFGLTLNATYAQYADLPAAAVAISADITLEAWVFANGTQRDWARIFDFNDAAGLTNNIILGITGGKLGFSSFRSGGNKGEVIADTAFPLNSWHHVAVTVGGNSAVGVTLFIDGEAVKTGTLSAQITSITRENAFVGHSNIANDTANFNGTIRDVRIYDVTRTAADIAADMVSATAATTNLVGYYQFTDDNKSDLAVNNGLDAAIIFTTNPPILSTPNLSFSNDQDLLGPYAVPAANAVQTITARFKSAPAAGEKVWGSLDDGGTWTDLSGSTVGSVVTWTGATLLSGTHTLELQVRDLAGNCGPLISQSYQVI